MSEEIDVIMKKSLRTLTALSIAASSILFVSTPTAMGAPYNGTSGDVACGTSGNFTILNNAVTTHSNCVGSVVIPQGVTSIGNSAFYNADFLTTLTIGNDFTSIGRDAFFGADLLTSVTIGSGGTSIGDSAFYNADSLTTLTIGNGTQSIGNYAFFGAISLTTVTIGSGGASIGDYAFYNLDLLTTLTIGSGTHSIGRFAFSLADRLTTVTIGSGGTSIGDFAFYEADRLTTVTIGSGGTSIGGFAFSDAINLTTVTIGSGGASIGTFAFYNAVSLTTVTIGSGGTSIGEYAFAGANFLTRLEIGSGVNTIGDSAFYNADSLTTLTISSGTTSIGNFAFSGANSLTRVTIPGSVTTIGFLAFDDANNLVSYQYCGDSYTTEELFDRGLIGIRLPCVTAPTAPSSVVATATGKRSATVSFAAPASDGDSTITSYTATSSPGGITKTLNQAGGGTFTFDNLEPSTSYTFAVTATNAIGTSAAATSNSAKTLALDVASLSALSFADDGTGTGGKIVWSGKNIDAVLYTGPASAYPGPYNYGAFTGGWNGRIRNLTPDTSYTVSIFAVSSDGVGESKSLTFKTSATLPALAGSTNSTISQAAQMVTELPKLFAWIDENVFVDGEGDRMKTVLNKFDAVKVPAASAYMKLPNPTVLTVSATSSTPAVCTVEGQVTVRSIAAGTCTISYTVSGGSKAPATLVKDFVFQKFAK
jgi:hypothetical protein